MDIKFNPKKLEKLNNPDRLTMIPPTYIWQKLDIPECKTIIDIGAGTGLFSKAFLERMESGTVYALDISEVMIQWMEENLGSYKGIIPLMMSETKTPLEDQVADLVLMITLHHELESPEKTLAEAQRLLKDGGKICIIDWKKEAMSSGPPLEIRCSTDDIASDLKAVGFNRIQTDTTIEKVNMVWAEK